MDILTVRKWAKQNWTTDPIICIYFYFVNFNLFSQNVHLIMLTAKPIHRLCWQSLLTVVTCLTHMWTIYSIGFVLTYIIYQQPQNYSNVHQCPLPVIVSGVSAIPLTQWRSQGGGGGGGGGATGAMSPPNFWWWIFQLIYVVTFF